MSKESIIPSDIRAEVEGIFDSFGFDQGLLFGAVCAALAIREDELSRLRGVEAKALEIIRPFAENACGGDGSGLLDVPNEHPSRFHDLKNPAKPTLFEGDFRAARAFLSEREKRNGNG